ncbi:MAG: hypothetical protein WBZ36_00440 [Candidatus Nitrosopolaris sp.]
MRFIFILLSKLILSKDTGLAKCALCGKKIASINALSEMIDSETYSFDGTDCALIFKKYRSVYGNLLEDQSQTMSSLPWQLRN